MKIGFIGQGWVGKNIADEFENRGFDTVRYSLEEPYVKNKDKIAECDIVFIAVPTPSTPKGFDDRILRSVLKLVGEGKIAVIKSTLLPGNTEEIQKENPKIIVMHSPEFLREASAAFDCANPDRNIVGIPKKSPKFLEAAEKVLSVLPKAPYNKICGSGEAELVKYGNNCFLYTKVLFMNLLYDLAQSKGIDFSIVAEAMSSDPRIGKSHMNPVFKSPNGASGQTGRGAGGNCFIKDFKAFADAYRDSVGDEFGVKLIQSMEKKNNDLLIKSGKDLDLLQGVYGKIKTKKNESKKILLDKN